MAVVCIAWDATPQPHQSTMAGTLYKHPVLSCICTPGHALAGGIVDAEMHDGKLLTQKHYVSQLNEPVCQLEAITITVWNQGPATSHATAATVWSQAARSHLPSTDGAAPAALTTGAHKYT